MIYYYYRKPMGIFSPVYVIAFMSLGQILPQLTTIYYHVNSLTLSLNRQQEAQKNYISALQNYWLNYYKIRKLTLHDFESGFSLADKFDFNTGIYR